jgi:hypothetical protein
MGRRKHTARLKTRGRHILLPYKKLPEHIYVSPYEHQFLLF